MRIWSLHPCLLDRYALVAGWRETLLAQKVLRGLTKGYTQHPQLERFRATEDPVAAVGCYLTGLADEADRRGYAFNRSLIVDANFPGTLPVTTGQLAFELEHLRAKSAARTPEWCAEHLGVDKPAAHPLFAVVDGEIEPWERP